MKIKIYAEIEVPVDERYTRTDYVTIVLEDEAILQLSKAILDIQKTPEEVRVCTCGAHDPEITGYHHFFECPMWSRKVI